MGGLEKYIRDEHLSRYDADLLRILHQFISCWFYIAAAYEITHALFRRLLPFKNQLVTDELEYVMAAVITDELKYWRKIFPVLVDVWLEMYKKEGYVTFGVKV